MNENNRREFLKTVAYAGLTGATVASGAAFFYNRDNSGDTNIGFVNDFSVEYDEKKIIASVKGEDRASMITKSIDMLGGISRFVKKGDVVAIKPNIAFATPATLGATTSPETVYEVARLCFSAGAKEVIVFDNPINSPESCYLISGISEATRKAGAKIIVPADNLFSNITLKDAKLIVDWPVFTSPLARADKLIGISPVKDHHRSGASMSMKNWYGLLGGRRNIFHQNINGIISELATLVKPTLVILDGTVSMMRNGPTGGSFSDLKQTNTIIASTDMVAADALGITLLERQTDSIPYLAMAEALGAGISDLNLASLMESKV